jgi:hypothetical protein
MNKVEKKYKTPFIDNLYLYIYDIYNIFDNKVIDPSISYNNVQLINGNYSLYNLYINITNNNHSKIIQNNKINSIYFNMKLNINNNEL